jgi:hypothetical protein
MSEELARYEGFTYVKFRAAPACSWRRWSPFLPYHLKFCLTAGVPRRRVVHRDLEQIATPMAVSRLLKLLGGTQNLRPVARCHSLERLQSLISYLAIPAARRIFVSPFASPLSLQHIPCFAIYTSFCGLPRSLTDSLPGHAAGTAPG